MEEDEFGITSKRDKLQNLLLEKIPGLVINGDTSSRKAVNLHISIPDIPNSAVIARVRSQLAISTGSVCSSGVETLSHVLQALSNRSDVATCQGRWRVERDRIRRRTARVARIAQRVTQLPQQPIPRFSRA